MAFIELRDRYAFHRHAVRNNDSQSLGASTSSSEVTPSEAQLAAMLENAKNSSWRQNLDNAADAQHRFMLPGQDVDAGRDTPEYVKRIDERSDEILRQDEERLKKAKENDNDPSKTRFWG